MGIDAGKQRLGIDKSSEVVDVAIRIVALDALLEPEDLRDSKAIAEVLFDFLPAEQGIPVRIEEHGFGGEELARAVDLDGSAFKDHASFEDTHSQTCRDLARYGIVQVPWRKFPTPSVEFPIGDCHFACVLVLHKNRSVVATPDIIVRMIEKFDPLGHRFCPIAGSCDGGVVSAGRIDSHRFKV